jgi:hypothetical protein
MLFRVRGPEGVLHLRARADTGGPAWARTAGLALEHVERAGALAARLREAARRLDAQGTDLEHALREAFVGCTVEILPTLPSGVAPPRWPLRVRTGGPGTPWPFDPELAALELGLRRALKREAFDEDEARADLAWLTRHGLAVRRVGAIDRDGRRSMLAAREESALDALEALELSAQRGEASAVAELGAWLGYPPCCVDAFAALGPRDDALSFALRLADPREGPLPPELLVLSSGLALVSHLPCDPRCGPTLVQARAVRAALAARSALFDDAWHALAARVHVIDAAGRTLALAADDVPGGFLVRDAVELTIDGQLVPKPALHGVLELRGRTLLGAGLDGVLVADHRGG